LSHFFTFLPFFKFLNFLYYENVKHTHTHTFNGLFSRTICVSWHQKGKPFWILLKQEMMGGCGISWTICKPFAPHSIQITTPVPHHSIFYGPDALLMPNQQCQSTEGILNILYYENVINATESSILMTSCIICYVALSFNHTFEIDGQRGTVKL